MSSEAENEWLNFHAAEGTVSTSALKIGMNERLKLC